MKTTGLNQLTTSENFQHPMQGLFDLHRKKFSSTLHPIENGKGFPPQLYLPCIPFHILFPQKKLLCARTQSTLQG